MKKLLTLPIAMSAAFFSPVAFSESEPQVNPIAEDIQIFTKDFGLSVKKESEIIVELPNEELVELDIDKLIDHKNMGMPVHIGNMDFQTTATSCEATVTTRNNFELQGSNAGVVLASYNVRYMEGATTSDTTAGTTAPNMPMEPTAVFGMGMPSSQLVNCEMAELFMDVVELDETAPTDFYGDVIHVEVRAES